MWALHREDYNCFDFCFRIAFCFVYWKFSLEIYQLLSWACNRLEAEHDQYVINDDHHAIIIIKDLPGLNPLVLESIPVIDFNVKDFEEGVECVVCLYELVDGDKARVLPSCNHQFHADCIDTWFKLQSTCPLCRNNVDSVQLETRPELGGGDEGLVTINVEISQDTTSYCDDVTVVMTHM